MPAKRASDQLKEKTNIVPVGNRKTEATAEDFQELGEIIADHADRLDQLLNAQYNSKFYGFFDSLALLEATYPTAENNAFAIIVDSSGRAQQIAKWDGSEWVATEGSDFISEYSSRSSFPDTGVEKVFYLAKDSASLYLWYDDKYQMVNKGAFEETENKIESVDKLRKSGKKYTSEKALVDFFDQEKDNFGSTQSDLEETDSSKGSYVKGKGALATKDEVGTDEIKDSSVTDEKLAEDYAKTSDLPEKVSDLENDEGFVKDDELGDLAKKDKVDTEDIEDDAITADKIKESYAKVSYVDENFVADGGLDGSKLELRDKNGDLIRSIDFGPLISGGLEIEIDKSDPENVEIVFKQDDDEVGRIEAKDLLTGVVTDGKIEDDKLKFYDSKNKKVFEVNLEDYVKKEDLSDVATSGKYEDLKDKPKNLSDFNNDLDIVSEVNTENTDDIKLSGDGSEGDKLKAQLRSAVLTKIDHGETAHGWGDHSQAGYAKENDIPTKNSELENDEGYITEDDLPTKTSDLDNDSDFVDKEYVDDEISKIDSGDKNVQSDLEETDSEKDSYVKGKGALATKDEVGTDEIKAGSVTEEKLAEDYAKSEELPTKTSDLNNDGEGNKPFITEEDLPDALSDLKTDESLYFDEDTLQIRANVGQITETFTHTGGSQVFTLTDKPTNIVYIAVNGQILADRMAQYSTDVENKKVEILDELEGTSEDPEYININYQFLISE